MLLEYIMPEKWVSNAYFQVALSILMLIAIRDSAPAIIRHTFGFIFEILTLILKIIHNLFIEIPFQVFEIIADSVARSRKREMKTFYYTLLESDDIRTQWYIEEAFKNQRDTKLYRKSIKELHQYWSEKYIDPDMGNIYLDDQTDKKKFIIDLRIIGKGVILNYVNEFFYILFRDLEMEKARLFFERRRKTI